MVKRRSSVEAGEKKPWAWGIALIIGIVAGAYLTTVNYDATILGIPGFVWLFLDVALLYTAYQKVRDYL
jgi:hypothetical protein